MIMDSMKLKYHIMHQKDSTSGMVLPNGTMVGMIKSLNSSVADITANPLAPSVNRAQGISFTNQCFYTNMIILGSSSPPTLTNVAGLITVFHKEVWVALFLTMIVLVLVSSLRVIKDGESPRITTLPKREIYGLLFAYISAVFLEGTPRSPEGIRNRALYGFWWLTVILLGNAFCGLFRASMMTKKEGEKVQSLEQLSRMTDRIVPHLIKDTAYELFFRSSELPVHQKLLAASHAHKGALSYKDLYSTKVFQRMVRGEAVILNERFMSTSKLASICSTLEAGNFYIGEELFYIHYYTFGIRQDFDKKLLKKINTRIRWLVESGIPEMLLEVENRKYETCVAMLAKDEGSWSPLAMEDVGMILVFVFVGGAASATVLAAEVFTAVAKIQYTRVIERS